MTGEEGKMWSHIVVSFLICTAAVEQATRILNFNSSLQDSAHASCMESFLKKSYSDLGWTYNSSNLTTTSWIASFTLSPVTIEDINSEKDLAYTTLSSAVAHLLSGVNAANVTILSLGDISVLAPTFKPTAVPTMSAAPSIALPTFVPTSSPTTNNSIICAQLQQGHWCNDNQAENIYFGIADNATDCRNKCNSFVGVDFATGCCLFYVIENSPCLRRMDVLCNQVEATLLGTIRSSFGCQRVAALVHCLRQVQH